MKVEIMKVLTTLAATGLLVGCTSPSGRPDYTANGALIGGASGAAIGAIADRHAPGVGALIGGAAGLLAGGLIGHEVQRDQDAHAPVPPPPAPAYAATPVARPPSISDIKALVRSGVSDDIIISQISSSHAVYTLDANAIIDLNSAGVSQKVISYMIGTGNSVAAQAPPPPQVETVVVAPSPEYVWMPGEWVWNGGTWVWVGGRWAYPPHPHAIWIEARWDHSPRGWHRVPGHWR